MVRKQYDLLTKFLLKLKFEPRRKIYIHKDQKKS